MINYGEFNVQGNTNINSGGIVKNNGALSVNGNLNNNSRLENHSLLSVAGNINSNSRSVLLNSCTFSSRKLGVNSDVQFRNSGTMYVNDDVQLNNVSFAVTPGAILRTAKFASSESKVNNEGTGCALLNTERISELNNTVLNGSIAYCDSYRGLETSNNTRLLNGASVSCVNCAYTGGLSNTNNRRMTSDNEINAEETLASLLSVYPNPASGSEVIISIPEGSFSYKVFSLQGSLISSGQSSSNAERINIEKMEPGMYLIEAKDQNGNRLHKKLLVK